jgi:hypothetical protein
MAPKQEGPFGGLAAWIVGLAGVVGALVLLITKYQQLKSLIISPPPVPPASIQTPTPGTVSPSEDYYVVLSNPAGYFEVNVCLDSCSCDVILLNASHTVYKYHWLGRGDFDETPQPVKIETPGEHKIFLSVRRTEGVGDKGNWPWTFYLSLCTALNVDGSCQVSKTLYHGTFTQGSFTDKKDLPPLGEFKCNPTPWGAFTVFR